MSIPIHIYLLPWDIPAHLIIIIERIAIMISVPGRFQRSDRIKVSSRDVHVGSMADACGMDTEMQYK